MIIQAEDNCRVCIPIIRQHVHPVNRNRCYLVYLILLILDSETEEKAGGNRHGNHVSNGDGSNFPFLKIVSSPYMSRWTSCNNFPVNDATRTTIIAYRGKKLQGDSWVTIAVRILKPFNTQNCCRLCRDAKSSQMSFKIFFFSLAICVSRFFVKIC